MSKEVHKIKEHAINVVKIPLAMKMRKPSVCMSCAVVCAKLSIIVASTGTV